MKMLRRRRWVATTALSALLTGQVATPLVQAQTNNSDATFRNQVNVPVQAGSVAASPAASPSAPTHTASDDRSSVTRTPIKHVILIIGENRTFDHVFATYTPPAGQTVFNLLSEGIVDASGNPGVNFNTVQQWQANDTTTYSNSPTKATAYTTLPQMNTGGAPTTAHFSSVAAAQAVEPALDTTEDYTLLTVGGTGLPNDVPDTRFSNWKQANGPMPMDNYITYDDYAASPVHRFFQMWQQTDCNAGNSTTQNPSGCLNDLFPWVETSVGAGANGAPQPVISQITESGSTATVTLANSVDFLTPGQSIDITGSSVNGYNGTWTVATVISGTQFTFTASTSGLATGTGGTAFNDQATGEGSTSMQFFNVAQGDAPYFTQLAQTYALSDNFHQSIMGGTGANHIMLGFGTLIYYADSNGHPATPPSGQIEDPDPQAGTNNWYTEDGYGGSGAYANNGGSYVNCSDSTQPGVGVIKTYFKSLPYQVFKKSDCQKNAYYLVNNYNPGYMGDGTAAPLGPGQFTVPPSTQPNLGLLLSKNGISWKYYGEGWDNGTEAGENGTFCNICDPFLYSTQIMTNPTLRQNNQDIQNLYSDIQNSTLPAVSIVKPDGYLDGHPASSKLELFEAFTRKIINMVQANSAVWNETAIMITFDEGGGYWDSGYIQPIDFFGDGTRIPLLVVSPFSTGGHVVHTYYDHVSFDKFVESNWGIGTISSRTRDNLPNPISTSDNPYVPQNSPAIGDLMDMFTFPSS
jgi:acid phosphatase